MSKKTRVPLANENCDDIAAGIRALPASQQPAPEPFYDATEDMTVHELRMSIAAALQHADRTHKSRGCIGCEWCTLKALLEGYNADEDITEMRVWLAERQAAHEARMSQQPAPEDVHDPYNCPRGFFTAKCLIDCPEHRDSKTPALDVRDELRDEIAGSPIGSGYYRTSVAVDEAADIADAILAVFDVRRKP